MRAHFNRPLLDPEGNRVPGAEVRVLVPGTSDLLGELLFKDDSSGQTLPNPFTITNGEIDFYLGAPRRVRLGVTVPGGQEEFWENLDVTAASTDSAHPGDGADSMQVGLGSLAGVSATAAGTQAVAEGVQSTALGRQAHAAGDQAVALGSQAVSLASGAAALGSSASASGNQSTAVGAGAQAPFDQTTAVGAGARATEPNQVMLGTEQDSVEMPSGRAILHSPNGTRFLLSVSDTGHLYTQKLGAPVIPSNPDEGSEGDSGLL